MTDENNTNTESFEFKAEIRQLLHILAHSLYSEREVFLRELISNASDALHRVQFEMLTNRNVTSPEAELAIRLEVDEEAKTITLRDAGIGMSKDELVENLGTIAHSGVGNFLRNLENEDTPAADIIGQFGVGFYSVFMVAEEVRVISRSFRPEDEAYEWTSSAGESYSLRPGERDERGTSIIIKLKEDAAEFANNWKLEQIIKKHSNYIPFPIFLGDREINQQTALWRQLPSEVTEEKHNEFYRQLTLDFEEPLVRLHINTDAPAQVYALLYIPSKRERGPLSVRTDHGLKLYAKKVLIQEYTKDLLPNHFRFVEGVVDTEELPLNVSREMIQSSPAMDRVRKVLEGRLLKELKKLAKDDPDTYTQFWEQHGVFIKEGVATDFAGRDKLLPLLRFHSSKEDGLVSLADYAGRMGEEQETIYYLLGEDLTSVTSSPHLDYFRSHDIEVLYLVDPIDSFMVMGLDEYEGKALKNVDDPSLDLPDKEPETVSEGASSNKEFDRLKARFVDVLGNRIVRVEESRRLKNSPLRLVSPEDAPSREMQRVQRLLNQDFEVPKKIVEINRQHPLIQNLVRLLVDRPDEPLVNTAIEQLYENGLLIDGIHPNPAAMAPRIQSLLETAAAALVAPGD